MITSLLFATGLFFATPMEVEATIGLGGIQWEQSGEPDIRSGVASAWSWRRQWDGPVWYGVSSLFNAYGGLVPDQIGPMFFLLDFMGYYRFDLGEWQLQVGAGAALSFFNSRRVVSDPADDRPSGTYELSFPGIHAGFSGTLLRRVHPRFLMGLTLRFYSGMNGGACWEGPAQDCRGIDRFTQHWVFGLSFILTQPD